MPGRPTTLVTYLKIYARAHASFTKQMSRTVFIVVKLFHYANGGNYTKKCSPW